MAPKIFRRDIYKSHSNIKVAQYYYFFTRDTWRTGSLVCGGESLLPSIQCLAAALALAGAAIYGGRRDMILLRSALNFCGIPEVPHPITVTYLMCVTAYKQLCQIMKLY